MHTIQTHTYRTCEKRKKKIKQKNYPLKWITSWLESEELRNIKEIQKKKKKREKIGNRIFPASVCSLHALALREIIRNILLYLFSLFTPVFPCLYQHSLYLSLSLSFITSGQLVRMALRTHRSFTGAVCWRNVTGTYDGYACVQISVQVVY